VARLLVSVRSAIEATEAVAGGASIIDVKEPSRGALGRADGSVWRAVRRAVPESIPVSVALGELNEWLEPDRIEIPPNAWPGIAYGKLGLSNAGPDWRKHWRDLRDELAAVAMDRSGQLTERPSWVAVVYLDWETARAPDPDSVIRAAGDFPECSGILFDTWDKSRPSRIDRSWVRRFAQVRDLGRFLALAGSLDVAAIRRLADLRPDIFAVRGAACHGGDRRAAIDRDQVARLVEAANGASSAG
jgi:(5-formylfuran-3-yl)methyl phosphate synthase